LPKREATIPEPLVQDLAEFLSAWSVRTPTIWILFTIFIRENRLEGSPMQIQSQHIRSGEGRRRRRREKQFIHHLCTHDSNGRLFGGGGWVCGDNHANTRSCWSQCNIQAIEEGTTGSALRMGNRLARGKLQTSLYRRLIEQTIVFTAHDHS
jgi:hypothetical protein